MKVNTLLLNKTIDAGKKTTTFMVWTDKISEISSFMRKVVSIPGIPRNLKHQHDVGLGYWVEITVPTETFETILLAIINLFTKDSENQLACDFTQTTWAADMFFFSV